VAQGARRPDPAAVRVAKATGRGQPGRSSGLGYTPSPFLLSTPTDVLGAAGVHAGGRPMDRRGDSGGGSEVRWAEWAVMKVA
jgi:hypothetical protein